MITDDARLVDAGACQVESWLRFNPGGREVWALPGCNLTGNLELTLGAGRTRDDAEGRATNTVMQAKTLIKPLESNGWGWGLVLGNAHNSLVHANANLLGDVYAYAPASASFMDDRLVLHLNLGALYDKSQRRTRMTWGVGSETQLAASTWLVAETFGQNTGRPYWQVGVRHWLVRDRVQVDATAGHRWGGGSEGRWFSVGLRLLTPRLLD
ncbi:hypothetical protein [Ottowia sp.]|uniref:hypothetical protein n=1 Tax=Ottowia sp. TaxID=1898956 RepID=UPI002C4C1E5C|nr:hypothetical protein [Ottowia sp.]HOB65439.1 hypothetical protein [Ottowia sp.]HPZ57485.1 hypothetical protein [Ottowia sp.]HQD46475.1 hypothetical protein [Ottowia sp.]